MDVHVILLVEWRTLTSPVIVGPELLINGNQINRNESFLLRNDTRVVKQLIGR